MDDRIEELRLQAADFQCKAERTHLKVAQMDLQTAEILLKAATLEYESAQKRAIMTTQATGLMTVNS